MQVGTLIDLEKHTLSLQCLWQISFCRYLTNMVIRPVHRCWAHSLLDSNSIKGARLLAQDSPPNLFCQFQNKTKNMELWERGAQPKVHLERKNFMNRVFALQRSVLLL